MYEAFQCDPEMERKGIVLIYPGFRITIARAGGANKKYQKALEKEIRPYLRALKTDTLDPEIAEQVIKSVYAKAIILDWEVQDEAGNWVQGIEQPDGSLLPVTQENMVNTFDALPDLFDDIRSQAASSALFKASLKEEAAKNS